MVDYWNYIRQLQQLMDSIGPVQEELRRLQGLHKQLQLGGAVEQAISAVRERDELLQRAVSPTLARDLLDQVTISQSVFESAASLMPNPGLLQAAIRPLFDLPSLGFNFSEVAASLGLLNANVQAAPFLTELAVQPEEKEASDEEQVIEAVEERLIGIASPEAMEALRSVHFEPLRLVDRVLRRPESMLDMTARDFEVFVASLVDQLGFEEVTLTPSSNDGGRDVIATKRMHGLSILFAFECKRYGPDHTVGPAVVRALLGTIVQRSTRSTMGVLVTTSRFTSGARSLIITEPSLDGVDFDGLVDWLREYNVKRRGA